MLINDLRYFRSKFNPGTLDECWEWKGHRDVYGYGRMGTHLAHRIMYSIYNFIELESTLGMCVCHTCDNPGCVNPYHLFLATNAENQYDKVAKGRQAKGECVGTCKLSFEEGRQIYNDPRQQREICEHYGISKGTVYYIKNKLRRWSTL